MPDAQYDYDVEFERHPLEPEVAVLERKATAARKSGNLEDAVRYAEQAVQLADSEGVSPFWQMRPHMKLAGYLTDAGETVRAWTLCEKWLHERKHPFDRTKLYDRMRLILQKRKRHQEALVYSLCAILSYFDGIRHREELLTPLIHDGPLAANVKSALKRVRKEALADAVIALILRLHNERAEIAPAKVEEELRALEGKG